jgi:hypothetical protein
MTTVVETNAIASVSCSVSSMQDIPLTHIQESKTNARRQFDETKLTELADNIRQHGVLQPVLVRPLPGGAAGFYELVAGSAAVSRFETCGPGIHSTRAFQTTSRQRRNARREPKNSWPSASKSKVTFVFSTRFAKNFPRRFRARTLRWPRSISSSGWAMTITGVSAVSTAGRKKTNASWGGDTVAFKMIAGKAVHGMGTREVCHFLIGCSLVCDLYCPRFHPRQVLAKDTNLALTASRYKIDTAKLVADVRAELTGEKKKVEQRTNTAKTAKGTERK